MLFFLTWVFVSPPLITAEEIELFFINGKQVPKVVARVNGVDIDSSFLIDKLKYWKIITHEKGDQPTSYEEETFARKKIDEAIEHELLFQKSQELKIHISKNTIQKEINNIQKKFPDFETFLSALASQRLTVDKLAKKIERQLAEEAFVRVKIAPNIDVPKRRIKAYYQKHKTQFKTEVKYRVSHIFVAILTTHHPAPDDPKDRKKAHRMIQIINQDAQKKIDSVLKRLNKGEDFYRLCKTESEDRQTRDNNCDMGEIKLSETLPSLASAIADLQNGQTSNIIKSPYGYHILKVMGKTKAKQLSFKMMEADILNILLKGELQKQRFKFLTHLKKISDIQVFL